MSTLDKWTATVCRELGLDPAEVDSALILDLAREVAHGVLRPGAPVTAYLVGVAVGRGADPAEAVARVSELTHAWHPETPSQD
jgi:hypothetical protein